MALKKILLGSLAIGILGFFLFKQLESPESYVKRKTLFLIEQSSYEGRGLEALKRFSQIESLLHFDVKLQVFYQGKNYEAQSLNEARRLFMLYFNEKKTNPEIAHTKLQVSKKEDQKITLKFKAILKRLKTNFSCQVLLLWEEREKAWRLKDISLNQCKDTENDTF